MPGGIVCERLHNVIVFCWNSTLSSLSKFSGLQSFLPPSYDGMGNETQGSQDDTDSDDNDRMLGAETDVQTETSTELLPYPRPGIVDTMSDCTVLKTTTLRSHRHIQLQDVRSTSSLGTHIHSWKSCDSLREEAFRTASIDATSRVRACFLKTILF